MRKTRTIKYSFAAGATVPTAIADQDVRASGYAPTHDVAFGGVHCPAEFNTDVLTFKTIILGVEVTKMTKTVATGWNYFTNDELLQLGSSANIQITTNVGVSAAADILLELKS